MPWPFKTLSVGNANTFRISFTVGVPHVKKILLTINSFYQRVMACGTIPMTKPGLKNYRMMFKRGIRCVGNSMRDLGSADPATHTLFLFPPRIKKVYPAILPPNGGRTPHIKLVKL